MSEVPGSEIFCVHQVGKVGSTSVVESLRKILPARPIYQTHVLRERALLASIAEWTRKARRTPGIRLPWNLLASIELSRQLATGLETTDWYLLTLVREPIGRNVSAFFENLRLAWAAHLPPETRGLCAELLEGRAEATPEILNRVAADLAALFHAGYSRDFIDGWFDEEIRDGFGIDVFQTPFFHDEGYSVHRRGRVRLLTLRLENLETAFEPGLREWLAGSAHAAALDAPGVLELRRANDAGDKNYALLREQFLKVLTFDSGLLEAEYASRMARHFYTPAERERFAAKWLTTPGEVRP